MKKHWDNPTEHNMPEGVRVPAELVIGKVHIAPATVLAPMVGVTDTVFRRFIRNANLFMDGSTAGEADVEQTLTNAQSGCGLLVTEFTSADGLSRMRETKRRRYLSYYDDEHPIGAQLFGANPETLADAARIVEESGFDLIDLNLGCPAKRVVGSNGGSALLRDLPLVEKIFKAIRKSVSIPFTVKFRLGWNEKEFVCLELGKMAEGEGLNAVTLHGRTREQGYSGQARWEWIGKLKETVSIPVIGNGDIRSPEDAAAMVAQTGCDGVMIGRAAPSNPWIFKQIAEYTATGSYRVPTEADRYRMIRTYFQMLIEEAEATKDLPRAAQLGETSGKMKQFATWFTHGVAGGAKLRKAIYMAKTGPEVLAQVDDFFEPRLSGEVVDDPAEEPVESAPFTGCDSACCD